MDGTVFYLFDLDADLVLRAVRLGHGLEGSPERDLVAYLDKAFAKQVDASCILMVVRLMPTKNTNI